MNWWEKDHKTTSTFEVFFFFNYRMQRRAKERGNSTRLWQDGWQENDIFYTETENSLARFGCPNGTNYSRIHSGNWQCLVCFDAIITEYFRLCTSLWCGIGVCGAYLRHCPSCNAMQARYIYKKYIALHNVCAVCTVHCVHCGKRGSVYPKEYSPPFYPTYLAIYGKVFAFSCAMGQKKIIFSKEKSKRLTPDKNGIPRKVGRKVKRIITSLNSIFNH